MNKKYSKQIQKAIDSGKFVSYNEIFDSYSETKKKRILERANYLRAAMEFRELRKKQKLSQSALAKKMKVKREFISRLESGRQNITLDTLYRIGEALGKKVEVKFN
jgi:HTH-type transcriptional regulator / antitoxin HipB